ncbi:MAG: OmpH family outer membrane protein [Alloprevotella sp.]|nr:OmpH family outer membrane protein [Alloprevotella sp.]
MIKKILLAVLMLAPLSLSAQKFAHFDLNATASELPAYKTAEAELKTLGEKYTKDLEDMQKEIQTKAEKYQKEVNDQTPQNIRERYEQELQSMYEKFQQAQADNQKAFEEARQQKMQPIIQRIMDAVNAVQKEGSYVYVLDTQTALQANIFINTSISEDITDKIKKKLGL